MNNLNPITKLNYTFPGFGLQVEHDADQLIRAEFFDLNENLVPIEGEIYPLTTEIIRQLDEYQKNPKFIFNLPFTIAGTEHQRKVWQIMLQIKSGATLSYGEVAKLLSSAPRAVGGACGKNPFPVFIPCHRIIAANSSLGGFNSGNIFFNLGIKRWLLNHEGIKL
jgi:methylated-DNA-[protein]-cysteine S-methyltransferase